eukprot:TRINITY_DN91750_c0_g1_i1.p1 TRINITY_DN91750_c0_g1~~TRINITY_DN91750_c0_g1_i1.p1  ORF type:complete len:205 (-),score=70.78 TRINITY_DN91750_c0_g1_i1:44-658(-)
MFCAEHTAPPASRPSQSRIRLLCAGAAAACFLGRTAVLCSQWCYCRPGASLRFPGLRRQGHASAAASAAGTDRQPCCEDAPVSVDEAWRQLAIGIALGVAAVSGSWAGCPSAVWANDAMDREVWTKLEAEEAKIAKFEEEIKLVEEAEKQLEKAEALAVSEEELAKEERQLAKLVAKEKAIQKKIYDEQLRELEIIETYENPIG